MGTGVGNSAYSVIEQGRIGFILEASVKDRRGIIEEAAGVSRYKARRKVAMRKLEHVEVDLERIGQVHAEVAKRLRQVRRQAETALKYQELQTRLRDLRMVFALEEYTRLTGEQGQHQEVVARLQDQEAQIAARLGTLEAKLATADVDLIAFDEELKQLEHRRSESRSGRDVAATKVRDGKARLVEIDEQEADDQAQLANFADKVQSLEQQISETEVNLTKSDSDGDSELSLSYRAKREELDQQLAHIDGLIQQIEQRKGDEVSALRQLSRIEAEITSLGSTREGLLGRRKKLEQQHGTSTQYL